MTNRINRENLGTEIARRISRRVEELPEDTPRAGSEAQEHDRSGLEQFEEVFFKDLREIQLDREAAFATSRLPRPTARPKE